MEPWKRILLIMFFAQLLSAIGFSIMFPFLPLYVQSLGIRTGGSIEFWAGLAFSSQAATMMIASPIWGTLADRYGRKLMVERAMFGGAATLFLMAFARSAEELVLLRTLQGFITGTISAANALVAATAPREQTGYAMGILQMGLWGGIAIGPLIGGVMADAFGFRITFGATAALLALAGVIVWLGVEETFTPPAKANQPQAGFLADWRRILSAQGVGWAYTLRFLSQLGRVMIIPIAPLFIYSLLPDTTHLGTFTGLVVGLSAAAGTASAVYLGRLGDRVGHRRILTMSALIGAIFFLPQTFVSNAWQLLILQIFTGAATGGIIPALSALLARYTQPGEAGAVYGLDNSIVSAARAVAPLIGAAVAVWFGMRGTFAATGLIFFFVALLAAWRLPQAEVACQPQAA